MAAKSAQRRPVHEPQFKSLEQTQQNGQNNDESGLAFLNGDHTPRTSLMQTLTPT